MYLLDEYGDILRQVLEEFEAMCDDDSQAPSSITTKPWCA